MSESEKHIRKVRERMELEALADSFEKIDENTTEFFEGDFSNEELGFEDEQLRLFISIGVTFGSLYYRELLAGEDYEGESKEFVEGVDNENLRETLNHVIDMGDDFLVAEVNPNEVPNFDYISSVYLIESIRFGGAIMVDILNELGESKEEELPED